MNPDADSWIEYTGNDYITWLNRDFLNEILPGIMDQADWDAITYKVNGCAMKVHNTLGNGFQEVIYQRCLAIESSLKNPCITCFIHNPRSEAVDFYFSFDSNWPEGSRMQPSQRTGKPTYPAKMPKKMT